MDPSLSHSPAGIDGEEKIDKPDENIASTAIALPEYDEEAGSTVTQRRKETSSEGDGIKLGGADAISSTIQFTDFIPPTPPSLPPPPKYKLWLVVLILAYLLVWLGNHAGIVEGMSASGLLNLQASLFVYLAIIVLVLTYAMTELVLRCCTVTVRGVSYGLEPWLKRPRIRWVRRNDNNWMLEITACVIIVLEDGFQIFNPPPRTAIAITDTKGNELTDFEQASIFDHQKDPVSVVLRIEHRINPEKLKKYLAWNARIGKLVYSQPGLISVTQSTDVDVKGELKVLFLKFTSIDHLNAWMTSPIRTRMLEKLEPLLLAPSVFQLQRDRLLPDTFTDLLTRQGEGVPKLLPKKWKVWWLSTIGLWVVIFVRDIIVPYYFDRWGLTNTPDWIQTFVQLVIAFFFNAYVVTPFLMMVFSEWVRRKENERDRKEPWRTLNDGVRWLWLKAMIVAAYCGGCAIAWALNSSTTP